MDFPGGEEQKQPLGVIPALTFAFDRMAGNPILIAPILMIDLFLWFGPRLKASAIVGELASLVGQAPGIEAEIQQGMGDLLIELGERFNLFSLLTNSPTGLPSLMAGRMPALLFDIPGLSYARMPVTNPLGLESQFDLNSPFAVLLAWLMLTVLGAAIGALNHYWLARRSMESQQLSFGVNDVLRVLSLALVVLAAFFLIGLGLLVVFPLAWLILPMLGMVVLLLAFGSVFWLGIYLTFAPHGIVRHGLGVFRSMLESVNIVRWNFFSTLQFLFLVFIVSWLGGLIWSLPEESSWFSLLAVIGHAFVSATLLLASYVFYQSRREWMQAMQAQAAERKRMLSTSEVESVGKEKEEER